MQWLAILFLELECAVFFFSNKKVVILMGLENGALLRSVLFSVDIKNERANAWVDCGVGEFPMRLFFGMAKTSVCVCGVRGEPAVLWTS